MVRPLAAARRGRPDGPQLAPEEHPDRHRRPYDSEDDRTRALADFLNYYNFERRHSALGWLPPITRVPVVGPKVLPQESQDQTEEVTQAQLSIFDELGGV